MVSEGISGQLPVWEMIQGSGWRFSGSCVHCIKKAKLTVMELTLTGWSCSTPGPIIQTLSETHSSSESVAIVTSEGSNRSAVSRSSSVGNDSIH